MAVLDEARSLGDYRVATFIANKELIAAAVWWLFRETEDNSYKFKVGPIPVSIKIAKLRPILEMWVGPEV